MLENSDFPDIVLEILEEIEACEHNILYECIAWTQNEYRMRDRPQTNEICRYFGINYATRVEGDALNIAYDAINRILGGSRYITFFDVKPTRNLIDSILSRRNNPTITNEEKKKMTKLIFLIISAFLITAFFSYKNQSKNLPAKASRDPVNYADQIPSQEPGYICLVVAAHILHGINSGQTLSIDKVRELLSESTDFVCIGKNYSSEIENQLDCLGEPITQYIETSKEVYLRIYTSNILPVLGKTTKLEIKNKLDISSTYRLEVLQLLRTLKGLDQFNHI